MVSHLITLALKQKLEVTRKWPTEDDVKIQSALESMHC